MQHWFQERKKWQSRKLCPDPDKCPACVDFWKQFALLVNLGCRVTYWQMNSDWERKHKEVKDAGGLDARLGVPGKQSRSRDRLERRKEGDPDQSVSSSRSIRT